ncbi:MAG: DNA repair exonuclease [Dictyoglomus sp.]|nr:DNA repair exonuclease [Dictyoglomus sp.]MCX7941519.1 DNA repair exonuclease [Dictyoglomaceae bacterium]MDW8187861.1 DNA repair exonuclease [Dictyoglomus sp.]
MIKIVATADNHLNRFYKKMFPEQLRKRREKLRKAFKEVVDFSIKEKVDLFVQVGDLFDMPDPRNTELAFIMEEFLNLKREGINIFAIAGTHDSITAPDEDSYPIKIFEKAGVLKAFTKTREVEWYIWEGNNKEKLLISGLSTDLRIRGRVNPLSNIKINFEDNDIFKIFLLHYSVEKFAHPKAQEPQVSEGTLYSLPFDLYIIGHLHEHRDFVFGRKMLIIPGATEKINFGEEKNETGFYFIRIEGKKIFPEYIKVNSQPMKSIEIRTGEIPNENPTESILERIEKESFKEQLLRCRIVGPLSLSLYQKISFNRINKMGNDWNFFFDLDTQNLYISTEELPYISFSENWSVGKVLEKFTEELCMKEERDKEIIKEALDWIKENLSRIL